MKTYQVSAKCGHVGKGYYVVKDFPVKAHDGKEAAKIARNLPRVKHHHKNAILSVNEISPEEYEHLIAKNKADPYFHCTNVQEQRMYEEELYCESQIERHVHEISRKTVYYGKQLLRNPKRYMKSVYCTERYAV